VLLHPEAITLTQADRLETLSATVEAVSYQGAAVYVHTRLADGTVVTCAATPEASRRVTAGERVGLLPVLDRLRLFAV
jgi:hypothetical protein